jgi:hypothetical protein
MISTLLADPAGPDRRVSVRISHPPRLDPPYDDDHPASPARSGGSAAPTGLAAGGVECGPTSEGGPDTMRSGAGRTAMAYVRLCVEVLNGYRSPAHLRRIAGPVEFVDVIDQILRRHNACGHFLAVGRALNERLAVAGAARVTGPGRNVRDPLAYARPQAVRSGFNRGTPTRPTIDPATTAFQLTRLRVSEPRDGVAEVVAVLTRSGTSLAVAIRLERTNGTWICTIVQVV